MRTLPRLPARCSNLYQLVGKGTACRTDLGHGSAGAPLVGIQAWRIDLLIAVRRRIVTEVLMDATDCSNTHCAREDRLSSRWMMYQWNEHPITDPSALLIR